MRKKLTLTNMLEVLAFLTMITLIFTMVVQVFARYLLPRIPAWSGEEVTTLLLIWLAFIGAGIAAGRMSHISVDFLIEKLPENIKLVATRVIYVIICIFLLYFAYLSFQLAWEGRVSRTPRLGISMFWIQISIFTGAVIMLYYYFKHLVQTFRSNSKGG
ncbi:C4-dicarboxylate transport system permease small protein [Halalkalibacter wakoensis JCM 9140]|uniref:C4-dicarboxylate transport system permease small protein n=1 Tax=Halalkalibacter wakoensis JCM 9140 TaxID=1236970 RepID=W4Q6P8_9BACI|nr:TRAP transporter small permease [Halalkalibacter wakoensis]GAE27741.1 C4-dicarboxylate transport system permease small protein [Halalkalibacter wakoensis JCM 9140]